jgi:Zn-dependent peptidase ImmA (M78 family)
MHAERGHIDHRPGGASGPTTLSKINASESAEHQAKVFASAFLIDDKGAAELESPLEIATEFLVSLAAAEICYERILNLLQISGHPY